MSADWDSSNEGAEELTKAYIGSQEGEPNAILIFKGITSGSKEPKTYIVSYLTKKEALERMKKYKKDGTITGYCAIILENYTLVAEEGKGGE